MARVSELEIQIALTSCENKVELLTNSAAAVYAFDGDTKMVIDSVELNKLIVVLNQPDTLDDNELEILYLYALDKSGSLNTGYDSSTLTLNPLQ